MAAWRKHELCGAHDIVYMDCGAVCFQCRLVMCEAGELVRVLIQVGTVSCDPPQYYKTIYRAGINQELQLPLKDIELIRGAT